MYVSRSAVTYSFEFPDQSSGNPPPEQCLFLWAEASLRLVYAPLSHGDLDTCWTCKWKNNQKNVESLLLLNACAFNFSNVCKYDIGSLIWFSASQSLHGNGKCIRNYWMYIELEKICIVHYANMEGKISAIIKICLWMNMEIPVS